MEMYQEEVEDGEWKEFCPACGHRVPAPFMMWLLGDRGFEEHTVDGSTKGVTPENRCPNSSQRV